MSDPVFRRPRKALPLAAVAAAAGCEIPAGADPTLLIVALASLEAARPGELSFAENNDSALEALRATRASACLVTPTHSADVPAGTVALVVDDPARGLRKLAALIDPASLRPHRWSGEGAPHAAAFVHAEARLEPGVVLAPGVVIGPRAEIGAGTAIGVGCFIDADVRIGRGCAIDAQVSVADALVGDRVVLHAGARIGALQSGAPCLGRVILQDDVEIGANAVVMRGGMADTIVGEGAVVDAAVVVPADTVIARRALVRLAEAPSQTAGPNNASAGVSSVAKMV